MFVATVCLEQRLRDFYPNIRGYNYTEKVHIIGHLLDYFGEVRRGEPGIILLPGGYFSNDNSDYNVEFLTDLVTNDLMYELRIRDIEKIAIVTGIDSDPINEDSDIMRDQLALAVDSHQILGLGRKWYPTKVEREHIHAASGWNKTERDRSRIFGFHGKVFYMAVCYDSFGLRKFDVPNGFGHEYKEKVHGVLNVVHQFMPTGKKNSGNVYFAKHGFAGLSNHWNVPVFGATTFYGREIPDAWPTAVLTHDYGQKWLYSQNDMKPEIRYEFEKIGIKGKVKVRVYHI
jgi:hypothetical protein